MDYYRRYVGDYLSKTQDLSLAEDGAYNRLLDCYYAKEQALNPGKVYEIARASRQADRAAVDSVIAEHFTLEADGLLHNARADEELGIALPKIEKMREVARANGSKSKGRPKKPKQDTAGNQSGLSAETETGLKEKPNPVSTRDVGQPPSANHQPPTNPESKHRFPGEESISAPPPKAVPAETPTSTPEATARLIAECTRAGIHDPTNDGIVQRWIRSGYAPTQVAKAAAEAPFAKDAPNPMTSAYLDPIVKRIVDQDRKARAAAESKVKATQETIAEQRKRAEESVPMPDHMRPKRAAA